DRAVRERGQSATLGFPRTIRRVVQELLQQVPEQDQLRMRLTAGASEQVLRPLGASPDLFEDVLHRLVEGCRAERPAWAAEGAKRLPQLPRGPRTHRFEIPRATRVGPQGTAQGLCLGQDKPAAVVEYLLTGFVPEGFLDGVGDDRKDEPVPQPEPASDRPRGHLPAQW